MGEIKMADKRDMIGNPSQRMRPAPSPLGERAGVRGPSGHIPNLTGIARGLRQRETGAEAKLWARLRNRQLGDLKFRRQVPRANFVADFLCDEAMLIIELDGAGHEPKTREDERRTKYLETLGYVVLRFMNWDVRQNTDRVLDHIHDVAIARVKAPSPGAARRPLPKGRGEAAARGGRGGKQ
jgi:very-short-patch-repair endonuclease